MGLVYLPAKLVHHLTRIMSVLLAKSKIVLNVAQNLHLNVNNAAITTY